jgi:hypothetical protein
MLDYGYQGYYTYYHRDVEEAGGTVLQRASRAMRRKSKQVSEVVEKA